MIQQDIKAAGAASYSCLFVEQDRAGHWVVKDARSLCGGLFANRTEAIRFATYVPTPPSVIVLPDGLELDGPLDEQQESDPANRRASLKEIGAVKRTRTSTPVKELAPQASASTSSAMTARFAPRHRAQSEGGRLTNRFRHDKRGPPLLRSPRQPQNVRRARIPLA